MVMYKENIEIVFNTKIIDQHYLTSTIPKLCLTLYHNIRLKEVAFSKEEGCSLDFLIL